MCLEHAWEFLIQSIGDPVVCCGPRTTSFLRLNWSSGGLEGVPIPWLESNRGWLGNDHLGIRINCGSVSSNHLRQSPLILGNVLGVHE